MRLKEVVEKIEAYRDIALIAIKPYSMHEDDYERLWIVLCYQFNNPITPYVSWLYNAENDSMSWGHYYSKGEEHLDWVLYDFGRRMHYMHGRDNLKHMYDI